VRLTLEEVVVFVVFAHGHKGIGLQRMSKSGAKKEEIKIIEF